MAFGVPMAFLVNIVSWSEKVEKHCTKLTKKRDEAEEQREKNDREKKKKKLPHIQIQRRDIA